LAAQHGRPKNGTSVSHSQNIDIQLQKPFSTIFHRR
jgi:hypothetical protein